MSTTDVFLEKIKWLGHDAFRIDAEKVIYIDPYEIGSGPAADLILITHEHFDHCSPADVKKIQGENTVVITESQSAAKLAGNVRVVKPGETVTEQGVAVEAVPAYNTDKDFHPRENGWLGFIVTVDGVRVYHAGDTDMIPEMADIDADIAMLPVSGTYVMTADQAVEAALTINPKIAVPMHYGSVVGGDADAEAFRKALEGKIEVHILPRSS
ncbi:MAG: MBL fold metallo-hydrolase [Thermodesulfobacteriota bacterium]|nr:MBL fold metallo-hydrolase [Thermodesulfobacteriota bacterium]